MAASEDDIIRDQNERDNLQRAIGDVEAAIAASTPGARRTLENFLEQAKKRVAVLEKKIEESTHERETEAVEKVAMAARLAEKEAKLSEQEKETYSGFLAKEFFTKKDFGKLENFYARAWDKLSEGGKDEMSKRIDEGIRRNEFRFDELPKIIQEKETEHRAAKEEKSAAAQKNLGSEQAGAKPVAKTPESSAMKDIDLTSVDLSGASVADAVSAPTAASIPYSSNSKTIQRIS